MKQKERNIWASVFVLVVLVGPREKPMLWKPNHNIKEAAEWRQKENDARGLKDPESAKRRKEAAGSAGAPIRWNRGGLRWHIN